jgi:hypothetical protein
VSTRSSISAGDDGGLSRPRTRDDQQRTSGVGDGNDLRGVETFEDPFDTTGGLHELNYTTACVLAAGRGRAVG